MAQAIPKWVMKYYSILWNKFGIMQFSFNEVFELFNKSRSLTSQILTKLNDAGWLTISLDYDDARIRQYELENPTNIFDNIEEKTKTDGVSQ